MIKAEVLVLSGRARWPEILQEMTDGLISAFVNHGKTEEQAETDALVAVDAIIFMSGGQSIYFPMGLHRNIDARNKRIAEEFTGHNHSSLARRYGLSRQHVYRIIKKLLKQNRMPVRDEGGGS
jgi:Mor family transcriptional regulator